MTCVTPDALTRAGWWPRKEFAASCGMSPVGLGHERRVLKGAVEEMLLFPTACCVLHPPPDTSSPRLSWLKARLNISAKYLWSKLPGSEQRNHK